MKLIAATFCASVLAWISSTAGAQSRIVVTGIVLDSASALPIQGVEVSIEEIRRSTSTDSLGDFRLTSLPSGVVSILFRKFGYRAVQLRFRLSEGDSIDRRIILGRASTVLDAGMVRRLIDSSSTGDDRYTPSTARREARKLTTAARRDEWKRQYLALQERRPGMPESWYARLIAKTPEAEGRSAETIRKSLRQ